LLSLGENTKTLIEAELLEASFRAKSDSLQEVHLPTLTNLIDQFFGTFFFIKIFEISM